MIRILIADDSMFLRESMKRLFTQNAFEVVGEAADGVEAVALYQVLKPDLVTMDLTMPNLSGLDALKEIRHFDPKARVVMISAMGQASMVIECIQNGAMGFVIKPYKEEQLIKTIENCFSK